MEKDIQRFTEELSKLSNKYGVGVQGKYCCGCPNLIDITEEEEKVINKQLIFDFKSKKYVSIDMISCEECNKCQEDDDNDSDTFGNSGYYEFSEEKVLIQTFDEEINNLINGIREKRREDGFITYKDLSNLVSDFKERLYSEVVENPPIKVSYIEKVIEDLIETIHKEAKGEEYVTKQIMSPTITAFYYDLYFKSNFENWEL